MSGSSFEQVSAGHVRKARVMICEDEQIRMSCSTDPSTTDESAQRDFRKNLAANPQAPTTPAEAGGAEGCSADHSAV